MATLQQPKDRVSRNVLENPGGESMQTADSGFRELWDEQILSQVWMAQAKKNLIGSTSKATKRRNENIGI